MTDTDESERNTPSRLACAFFASDLAILAIHNLTDPSGRIAYAEAKDVPRAGRLIPAATDLLLGGSLSVRFWKLPWLTSTNIVTLSAGVTPTMHGFQAVDDGVRGKELTSFLQNLALFGAALAFFKRASDE